MVKFRPEAVQTLNVVVGKVEVDGYPEEDTPSWSEIVKDAHDFYTCRAYIGKTTIGGKTVYFCNEEPGLRRLGKEGSFVYPADEV